MRFRMHWHNRVVVPWRKLWGRIRGYTHCCAICGMQIKYPRWKYCAYCGDQLWFDTPEGKPTRFGFAGREFVAYSRLLTDENSVEIYVVNDGPGSYLMESFCEPMSTDSIISMFCEEYEAGRAC